MAAQQTPKRWFESVGFWSAVAAIATGVNTTLATGAKYENGWAAHDYLYEALDDYVTNSRLTDAYLAKASRNADEIFSGRPLATQAREDDKSEIGSQTPAPSTERQAPSRYTDRVSRLAVYGATWGVVHYVLAIIGIIAPVFAWLASGGGPVPKPPEVEHPVPQRQPVVVTPVVP
jgi:hypothetical protein